MLCPICEDLHRKHSHECELEAKAILEQHKPLTGVGYVRAISQDRGLDDTIVRSRKRQMELANELDKHREHSHAAA
jgi:hypothetical protein